MSRPLVIAHHLVWTAYGHWLPNDPRGSGSHGVHVAALASLGDVHHGRRLQQPPRKVVDEFYEHADELLKHPRMRFQINEFELIADAFRKVVINENYTCWACAIMPDHVHLLIRKHKHTSEQMVEILQAESRKRILEFDRFDTNHPVWTNGSWRDFVDHPNRVRGLIRYIEQNPIKENLPVQKWAFVKEYDGWPLHPGHNPNSPYARRLRGE